MHNRLLCDSDHQGDYSCGIGEEDEDFIDIQRDWSRYEEFKPLTAEEAVVVNLGDSQNVREVKIGESLSPSEATRMTELLREYQDIFAWSYADMPGLDPNIVEYVLPIDPSILPKK